MSDPLMLEVCVGSLEDAHAAVAAGADRLELCGGLELGGLTPTPGLVEQVARGVDRDVVAMVRPRAGGFGYSDDEFRCMLRDAELLLSAGAAGVVFGVLNPDSTPDTTRVAQMVAVAGGAQTVFHRAFDTVADPARALEDLARLGVDRVLTSGGAGGAIDNAGRLGELVRSAAGRIGIVAAGGVAAAEIPTLRAKGCRQFHIGASAGRLDPTLAREASAGLCDLRRLTSGEHRVVDGSLVARTKSVLDRG